MVRIVLTPRRMEIAVPKALGNGTVGLRLCQSPAVLVRTEFVTGHVPKNLSVGRTLKEHVAADQQPIAKEMVLFPLTYFKKDCLSIHEGGTPINIHLRWCNGVGFYIYFFGLRLYWFRSK